MRRTSFCLRRLSTSLAFLFLAWFCAQQPQSLVGDVVTWLRSAARFSHQERLAVAVQVALAQAAKADTTMVATDANPADATPALPVPEVVTGKVPLMLVSGLDVLPPQVGRHRSREAGLAWENRARDVPVPVPRVADLAVL